MGLDIFVVNGLVRVGDVNYDADTSSNVNVVHDDFDRNDLDEGLYEITGDYFSFRAGSYSGYNWFRDHLSLAALGVPASDVWEDEHSYTSQPFFYLINFSDCEGQIGPSVSELLWNQFESNRERVIRNIKDEVDPTKETDDPLAFETEFNTQFGLSTEDLEYFIETYDDFMRAFELAAQDGVVQFC